MDFLCPGLVLNLWLPQCVCVCVSVCVCVALLLLLDCELINDGD